MGSDEPIGTSSTRMVQSLAPVLETFLVRQHHHSDRMASPHFPSREDSRWALASRARDAVREGV
jgi:hypothetical protein